MEGICDAAGDEGVEGDQQAAEEEGREADAEGEASGAEEEAGEGEAEEVFEQVHVLRLSDSGAEEEDPEGVQQQGAPAGGCPPAAMNCFVAGTRVGDGVIEGVELGSEQATWRVGEPGFAGFAPELVLVREREVWLVQEADGGRAEVGFLRPESWFADMGVSAVGDWALLDLPELSLMGRFQVMELGDVEERIFARRPGFGRVTGRFRFSHGETVNLFVEGESAPIGVTPGHPFWSADRKD